MIYNKPFRKKTHKFNNYQEKSMISKINKNNFSSLSITYKHIKVGNLKLIMKEFIHLKNNT